jgi:hypothetical protein
MMILLFPFFWIPIVSEVFVPSMREFWFMGGFYWTPVSLSPTSYLDTISKKSIHIATIEALDFLDDIEIIEKSPIKYDIFRSLHSWYPIERKGYYMIDRDTNIEKYCWDDHPQDEWYSDNLSYIHQGNWKFPLRELQTLISSSRLFGEDHFFFFERESILRSKSIILLM